MPSVYLLALVTLIFSVCDGGLPHFEENYLVGMRAYTQEDWAVAAAGMQQAVKDFESFNWASVKCLNLCENQKVGRPLARGSTV